MTPCTRTRTSSLDSEGKGFDRTSGLPLVAPATRARCCSGIEEVEDMALRMSSVMGLREIRIDSGQISTGKTCKEVKEATRWIKVEHF